MSDVVVIKSGQVVHFPVTSGDPLARYQQQLGISQVSNLHDLGIVRSIIQADPRASTDQITTAVSSILASSNTSTILQLEFPDLTVEEGATLVFAGPITTLTAGNVIILGEVRVYGSLDISCSTIGGTARPVITSISPSTGSTLGGTRVTLQGSGFISGMQIYFGGTYAGQAFPDSWTVDSPPMANVGPVDITASINGTLTSLTSAEDVFTYVYIPGVASIDVPGVLWTGETADGTITLNEPASSGGTPVTLSSGSGLIVPAGIFVNAGGSSATFSVTVPLTATLGEFAISATGPDGTAKSTTGKIHPGEIFVDVPVDSGIVVGEVGVATVLVRTPAPASGGLITLTTNFPQAVSIPADVSLPGGSTSALFDLRGLQPMEGVTISASYEGNSVTSAPFTVTHRPVPPPPPPKNGKPI
jgi:hypothetical protein